MSQYHQGENMAIKYAEDIYDKIESKQDPCLPVGQQPDGYGRRISMPYKVRFNGCGHWHRVYCCIFSNVGTLYVLIDKEWVCFRNDDNLRLTGEWPKAA
jgi:hypothetical protein